MDETTLTIITALAAVLPALIHMMGLDGSRLGKIFVALLPDVVGFIKAILKAFGGDDPDDPSGVGSGRDGKGQSSRLVGPYSARMVGAFLGVTVTLLVCNGCKPGTVAPFHWPDMVRCAGDVGDLVGAVTQIFIADIGKDKPTPAAEEQLENLAKQHGASAVLCIVDQLYRDWSAPGASQAPWRAAAASRARGFLVGTGTKLVPAD